MPASTTNRLPAPPRQAGRARRPQAPALRFDQRLVLNQWILSLFEEDSFIPLTEPGWHEQPGHPDGVGVQRPLHRVTGFRVGSLLDWGGAVAAIGGEDGAGAVHDPEWSTTIILHYQRQLKLTVAPV